LTAAYRVAPEEVLVRDGRQGYCLVLDLDSLFRLHCLQVLLSSIMGNVQSSALYGDGGMAAMHGEISRLANIDDTRAYLHVREEPAMIDRDEKDR